MTNEQLRQELARGLSITVEHLQRLANIWAELERRGEDLSDLRRGIAANLSLIASGTLAADAVVALASRPTLLKRLAGVPLDQQRAIASGEPLPVVVDDGKKYNVEMLPATALTMAQTRQVIDYGSVRTVDEQRAILADLKMTKRKPREESERRYNVHADRERDGLFIGKMFVPKHEVIAALATLAGELETLDTRTAEYETASVRLTTAEKNRLRAVERQRGHAEHEGEHHLVRQSLRALGLI